MKKRLILFLIFFYSAQIYAEEFIEEKEKDFPLRSIGSLDLTNAKGDIYLQGWALDKIRIKLRKKVTADSKEAAKKKFGLVDYRFESAETSIKISAQYGKDMSIGERLQEKEGPTVGMTMTVFAPSNLKLHVWSIDGKVVIKGWNSQAEIRSNRGLVQIEALKGEKLSILCPSCPVRLKNIRASLSCRNGSGDLDLKQIEGKEIYAETESGALKLSHITGKQLYISRTGAMDGLFLNGKVQFQTKEGIVHLREISGVLEGASESGDVIASIRDWDSDDESLIESIQGKIQLTVPRRFSSDFDFWSVHGKVEIQFPWEKVEDQEKTEKDLLQHKVGKIGEGGSLLKIVNDSGDIYLFKKNL